MPGAMAQHIGRLSKNVSRTGRLDVKRELQTRRLSNAKVCRRDAGSRLKNEQR